MKKIVCIAALLTLTSCAGAKYAMDNYSGVEMVGWTSPTTKTSFLVYDKPAENRMMISLGVGESAMQGLGKGLTLGAADTRTPEGAFQAAALEWLALQGRTCTATKAFVIIEPQYEVQYTCQVVATPAPS